MTRLDATDLVAFATSLADGKPLQDVELSLARASSTALSNDQGLATLPLGAAKKNRREMLLARLGDDVAFLPDNISWRESGDRWVRRAPRDELRPSSSACASWWLECAKPSNSYATTPDDQTPSVSKNTEGSRWAYVSQEHIL